MNPRLQRQFKKAHPLSIGIHKKRDNREIEEAEIIAKTELKIYGYL
jgi:hypothetical protein